jgi:hypothetical protein
MEPLVKHPGTRWPILATAAALALVLAAPASAADGPWGRAPRTGQADVSAREAKPLPAFAPAERDALTRALERGRIDPATYALERARALFDLSAVRSRYGDVRRADPREATLILRDLVLRLDELRQRSCGRRERSPPTDGWWRGSKATATRWLRPRLSARRTAVSLCDEH